MTKVLAAALVAGLSAPLLADAQPPWGRGPAPARCSSLFGEGGEAPAFAFDESDLGFGRVASDEPRRDEPRRFALCAPATGMPGPGWNALSFPLDGTRDPREPLRGVRNADAPSARFWRGMLIITGTEIVSGAVLALLPKTNSNWEEDAFTRGSGNFRRAWTTLPVWDSDGAFHDWFGHPYAGAFYYNMIRSQGGTIGQSFAFASFQSFLWEYVLESWAEQPSIQDLVSTSLIGAVVGELFHRWSVAILRKGPLNFGQKALVFFLNPSYVINNGYRPPG